MTNQHTRIGIISDTHMPERWATLPQSIFDIFADVDLILHAGDVGELWVLDQLSQIAPVIAVHGNDETAESQRELPYQQLVPVNGRRIFMWHSHYADRQEELAVRKIPGTLREKLNRTAQHAQQAGAQFAILGHWHIPLIDSRPNLTIINPGAIASGNPFSRQRVQTIARLELSPTSHKITHFNLADGTPYQPPTQLDEGFAYNLPLFNETILGKEFSSIPTKQLWEIMQIDLDNLYPALLRVAHRCWANEAPFITKNNWIAESAADQTIPEAVKTQAIQAITKLSP